MKILIATGIYPPESGGPATYAKLMHEELPKYGIESEVLPFRDVRHLPRVIRHIAYFLKVLKKGKGVDVIFTQDTLSTGLPTILAAKFLRKPVVLRVPGDYAWEQAVQRFGVTDGIDDFQNTKYNLTVELFRYLQKKVVKNATVVVTPSLYFRDLVSRWVTNPEKVRAIYNGIKLIRPTDTKSDARAALGMLSGDRVVVSVGRLVPWKGFGMLIELIKDLGHPWKLYIVGDGPDRAKLEKKAADLKVADQIIFTGAVSRENVFKYYAAGDVFALNTSFESFSFQVVEAMNCGIPVVTTNVGDLTEIIKHGEEGFLLEVDDVQSFRTTIENILKDTDLRKKVIEGAQAKVEKFSIEAALKGISEIIKTNLHV